MQHKFIRETVVDDECCQSTNDEHGVALLDVLWFPEVEDLHENASHSEVHGHFVGWKEISEGHGRLH